MLTEELKRQILHDIRHPAEPAAGRRKQIRAFLCEQLGIAPRDYEWLADFGIRWCFFFDADGRLVRYPDDGTHYEAVRGYSRICIRVSRTAPYVTAESYVVKKDEPPRPDDRWGWAVQRPILPRAEQLARQAAARFGLTYLSPEECDELLMWQLADEMAEAPVYIDIWRDGWEHPNGYLVLFLAERAEGPLCFLRPPSAPPRRQAKTLTEELKRRILHDIRHPVKTPPQMRDEIQAFLYGQLGIESYDHTSCPVEWGNSYRWRFVFDAQGKLVPYPAGAKYQDARGFSRICVLVSQTAPYVTAESHIADRDDLVPPYDGLAWAKQRPLAPLAVRLAQQVAQRFGLTYVDPDELLAWELPDEVAEEPVFIDIWDEGWLHPNAWIMLF